jgi:hypothetical protein
MAAVTVVANAAFKAGGDKWGAVLSRGGKLRTGYITLASTYQSGGFTWTLPFSTKTDYFEIEQQIPSSYYVTYDRVNSKIKIYDTASATYAMIELASDVSVASLTSMHFLAVGS